MCLEGLVRRGRGRASELLIAQRGQSIHFEVQLDPRTGQPWAESRRRVGGDAKDLQKRVLEMQVALARWAGMS